MIVPKSSTAPPDAAKPKRYGTVGSSQTTGAFGMVPLSEAQTLTTTFARAEDFEDALKKYIAEAQAAVDVVGCRYAYHSGWVVVQSPTFRQTAGAFAPVDLFGTPIERWAKCDRTLSSSELPETTMFQVTGIGASAPPFKLLSGLLNSTDIGLGIASLVESKFGDALALAQHEWFEDGTESEFSRALATLVHTYGDTAVATVESFLGSPTVNTEVAVEAAQSLGEIDHPPTYRYRKSLLEKLLLTSPSTRLRHGAASGLAATNDPSSLPKVTEATNRESNSRLRRFLELLVDQLERARACRSS